MTNKVELIRLAELKLHKKASELVPEMNVDEWGDFKKNIKKHGVRQPIHINMKNEILDGRHRFLACRDLGIKKIQAMRHNLTEQEEMEFVRDTAIERRNITVEQRLSIVLETEEFIKSIYEKGKNSQGNRNDIKTFSPTEEKVKKPHNSVNEIAKLAKTSSTQVSRMRRIKKEDPQLYKDVVDGKKTIYTAYHDLPTVKKPESKPRVERGDPDVKIETSPVMEKRIKRQSPPELTGEQIKEQMFEANILTFYSHLSEIEGFVGRTENFDEVVQESVKRDEASMTDYKNALKRIINLLEEL